jgi:hypothetical protein
MNEKDFDRLLSEALYIPIPKGLAQRLERKINHHAKAEKNHAFRTAALRLAGLAAALLLAIGIFLQIHRHTPAPADTFSDPAEAAVAAEHALAFMSAQLNKGLNRVSAAGQDFEKVNKTIEKYFNK